MSDAHRLDGAARGLEASPLAGRACIGRGRAGIYLGRLGGCGVSRLHGLDFTGSGFALLDLGSLDGSLPRSFCGPVGWSIVAAFAHIGGQLLLARLWLIPHDGVFYLTPIFAAAALGFGIINGLVAARLLPEPAPPPAPPSPPHGTRTP